MELKKIKLSERIIDHLIQAVLIFISVFLAFWLSNYQVKKEEISITQKAKQTIVAELEMNLSLLKNNGEYHRLIYMYQKDFFKNKLDTIKQFRWSEIPQYKHRFAEILLTKNTLILVNDTRINLGVENIVILNRLSAQITKTQKAANQFSDFLNTPINKNVKEQYSDFYYYLSELWLNEDHLIQNIESIIQKLK